MGYLKIGKGIIKIVEGTIEGDVEKIVKGVGKVITGTVTTITRGGDDESSDLLDDE